MKRNKMSILLCALLPTIIHGISATSDWRPLLPHPSGLLQQEATVYGETGVSPFDLDDSVLPQVHPLAQQDQDQCALYKVSMTQQLYFEYIHYKMDMPNLKEFTLCMWTKFYNHTNDHPLFSYAVGDQSRGILSWIANTARSSYYMLNVDGHNLYRLNYPLRLNKWYHSCQSWNGRTGEWQIWVNDERVGRGFHNRLVGHVIKGNGIAISGQEQRQLGGGFLEGDDAPQGSGGYLGELTMVQLYNVALTAGKAHRDHKHHHAHHYEHDTSNNTPRPTQKPVTGPPLPMNPYLTGGQINHRVKINPGAQLQVVQNGVTLRHPSSPIAETAALQPFPPANPDALPVLSTATSSASGLPGLVGTTQYFGNRIPQLGPVNVGNDAGDFGYVNGQYHSLFKREKNVAKRQSDERKRKEGEEVAEESIVDSEQAVSKREAADTDDKVSFVPKEEANDKSSLTKRESDGKKKRGLVQLADGSVLDDSFLVPQGLDNNYFSGLASFGLQLPSHDIKDEEREPAEAEVRMIMDICDGCAEEPFEKALVMGWRTVPKKLYSGALYLPAAQTCRGF